MRVTKQSRHIDGRISIFSPRLDRFTVELLTSAAFRSEEGTMAIKSSLEKSLEKFLAHSMHAILPSEVNVAVNVTPAKPPDRTMRTDQTLFPFGSGGSV